MWLFCWSERVIHLFIFNLQQVHSIDHQKCLIWHSCYYHRTSSRWVPVVSVPHCLLSGLIARIMYIPVQIVKVPNFNLVWHFHRFVDYFTLVELQMRLYKEIMSLGDVCNWMYRIFVQNFNSNVRKSIQNNSNSEHWIHFSSAKHNMHNKNCCC